MGKLTEGSNPSPSAAGFRRSSIVRTRKRESFQREANIPNPALVQIRSATFQFSAPDLALCPESDRAEIAFIGRSNVGKSSLLNLITGQKGLAKVSATPGKTKLINFFLINNDWHLVDLPGYGYAKVSQEKRGLFSIAIAEYLEDRPNLRHVFVLIDSRLSPQTIDLEFLEWLTARATPFSLVFTKTDKLKANAIHRNVAVFLERLSTSGGAEPAYHLSSATTRLGRGEILNSIERVLL